MRRLFLFHRLMLNLRKVLYTLYSHVKFLYNNSISLKLDLINLIV